MRPLLGLVITLLIVQLTGCTPDVRISMSAENPPTFKFKRNFSEVNTLLFLDVIEIAPENQAVPYDEQHFDKNLILWRIEPEKKDTPIDDLPSITYGRVPPGFVQLTPKEGSPLPLTEGKVY